MAHFEARGQEFGGDRPDRPDKGDRGAPAEGAFRSRTRRPVTDYSSTVAHWMESRGHKYRRHYRGEHERPSPSYMVDMIPPSARVTQAADSIPAKHLHSSLNKIKHPINVVRWTPEGRRLLTASSSGEFTLWNGTGFNFETIMQAHDSAIRALSYSNNNDWLISGDHDGLVKYWQPNFNNLESVAAHTDPIRDLAFSPNDSKFVTASDDSTLKVFDFASTLEETTLKSHGWDVKTCDWHPTKGLLVSGSKDHLVKLWDPRSGRCLTTLHGHKNTITKTLFERVRGVCFATSARDQTARVFDLRMMRDIALLKGNEKDITTLAWHPIHPNLLTTGGHDGSLYHYLLDEPNTPPGQTTGLAPYDAPDPASAPAQSIYPAHKVQYAHDFAVWSLDWHPLGHVLASGSNDRLTRFWARPRPGDTDFVNDRYHIGENAAVALGTWDRRGAFKPRQGEDEQESDDEADGLVDQKMPIRAAAPGLPGLPGIPGLPMGLGGAPPPPPPLGAGGIPVPPPGMPLPIPGMPRPNGAIPPPPFLQGLGPNALAGLDPSNPADLAKLAELMQKAGVPIPPPPPGMAPSGGMAGDIPGIPGFSVPPPPPPIPGMNGYGQSQGQDTAGSGYGDDRRQASGLNQEDMGNSNGGYQQGWSGAYRR
ncbi:Polyadenylation factor subunit 2 [Ceratocystis lukuohia]|uniref:Polyadenylation factor subunit 2 n=3 Tax=Ceratocystis TaxID=5157 RepID=A0A0F8D0U4_CERFI|nr:Polyadenylation factor subunit 2 [Ceratocystis platani]PHH54948.1 Polyadenylation factor subunit 2 [Ceratocystis fimbriata CBS 114723]